MGNMFTHAKTCKLTQLNNIIQMISRRKQGYIRTRSQITTKLRTIDRKMNVCIKKKISPSNSRDVKNEDIREVYMKFTKTSFTPRFTLTSYMPRTEHTCVLV